MLELQRLINTPSDINEHLQTMYDYAQECSHITEMGVRDVVSAWAWLEAKPKKVILYDIADPPKDRLEQANKYANDNAIELHFIKADVRKVEIEPTDLLFIDTAHYYDQLKIELQLHAPKTKKYIIMHDTEFFQYEGEDGFGQKYDANGVRYRGMGQAITEFLDANSNWSLIKHYTHNWGMSILKRNG